MLTERSNQSFEVSRFVGLIDAPWLNLSSLINQPLKKKKKKEATLPKENNNRENSSKIEGKMALQWMILAYVVAAEAGVAILLTLPSPKALKSRIVSLISLILQPSLFVVPFSAFQLLGIFLSLFFRKIYLFILFVIFGCCNLKWGFI